MSHNKIRAPDAPEIDAIQAALLAARRELADLRLLRDFGDLLPRTEGEQEIAELVEGELAAPPTVDCAICKDEPAALPAIVCTGCAQRGPAAIKGERSAA